MHCGGPLPSDFLPALPSQSTTISELRRGPTAINLSGQAPFSAAGLTGTVRSTIVLHIQQLRRTAIHMPRRVPLRDENRVITATYRIARLAGSVAVDVAGDPSTCAAFDACEVDGTLSVHPGAAHGRAYVLAYDSASTTAAVLRRSLGLARGRPARYASAAGLATWTSSGGTISAALNRAGIPACAATASISRAAINIAVKRERAIATFGDRDYATLPPEQDLLRTRCPGPDAADLASGKALATGSIPLRALGRRTVTFRLRQGAGTTANGYRWRTRPNLTIVLRRIRVTQQFVPSSDFET
jgi:hypothetical protein